MNSLPKLSRKLVLSIGASFVSLLMIVGAFVLSGGPLPSTPFAEALSTEEVLQEYATKDSDSDGLPDWQESLYGTDPNNARSFDESMTDGQAVNEGKIKPRFEGDEPGEPEVLLETLPGTLPDANSLTDKFSREFFERLARASTDGPLTAEQKESLVNSLLVEFSTDAARILTSTYSRGDIKSSAAVSVDVYVGQLEKVLLSGNIPSNGSTIVDAMQALLESNDEQARAELNLVSGEFSKIKDGLLAMSVPPEFVSDHLLLVKVYDTLSRSTKVIAQYEKDPMALLGALKLYLPASKDYLTALDSIINRASLTYTPGTEDAGYLLFTAIRAIQTL
jgi:hypothetical protein